MTGIEFDFSDVARLEADLRQAGTVTREKVKQATEVTARKTKDHARKEARGIKGMQRYPESITYDTTVDADGVGAEIGPEQTGQGSLFVEEGSMYFAPHPHLAPALAANQGDYIKGIELAVAEALAGS